MTILPGQERLLKAVNRRFLEEDLQTMKDMEHPFWACELASVNFLSFFHLELLRVSSESLPVAKFPSQPHPKPILTTFVEPATSEDLS